MTSQKDTSLVRATLSFRVPAEQLSEIDEEISKDHRKSRSDLVEPVWDWGPRRAYTKRVSEQTQEQLYIALETILERAPSAVIEDVARILTARAGKYGDVRPERKR